MRAVIIGNGNISDDAYIKKYLQSGDVIICADGGYNHAVRMQVKPDIVIGDMDSVCRDVRGIPNVVYPKRKDFTDGELAVRHALEQGADEVLLLGFTGTRLDHTLTNIFLLKLIADAGKTGFLADENNEIYLSEQENLIRGRQGDLVSIVPLEDMHGIYTERLEYPLKDETLHFGQSRGVSNVMLAADCRITVRQGFGLIIKSRD